MLAKIMEIRHGPGVLLCGKSNPRRLGKVAKGQWRGMRAGIYFQRATSSSSDKITTGIIKSIV